MSGTINGALNECATAITHDSDPRMLRLMLINHDTGEVDNEGYPLPGGIDLSAASDGVINSGETPVTVDALTGGTENVVNTNIYSIGPVITTDSLSAGGITVELTFSDATTATFVFTLADIQMSADAYGMGGDDQPQFPVIYCQGSAGYLNPYLGKEIVSATTTVSAGFGGSYTYSGATWNLTQQWSAETTLINNGEDTDPLTNLTITLASGLGLGSTETNVGQDYTVHNNGDEVPSTPVFWFNFVFVGIVDYQVVTSISGAAIAANLVSGSGTQNGVAHIPIDLSGAPTLPYEGQWTIESNTYDLLDYYTDSANTLTGGTIDVNQVNAFLGLATSLFGPDSLVSGYPITGEDTQQQGDAIVLNGSYLEVTIANMTPVGEGPFWPDLLYTEPYELRLRNDWCVHAIWTMQAPFDFTNLLDTDTITIQFEGSIDGVWWAPINFGLGSQLITADEYAGTYFTNVTMVISKTALQQWMTDRAPNVAGIHFNGNVGEDFTRGPINYLRAYITVTNPGSRWEGLFLQFNANAREI